jgi:hypothetical protein
VSSLPAGRRRRTSETPDLRRLAPWQRPLFVEFESRARVRASREPRGTLGDASPPLSSEVRGLSSRPAQAAARGRKRRARSAVAARVCRHPSRPERSDAGAEIHDLWTTLFALAAKISNS